MRFAARKSSALNAMQRKNSRRSIFDGLVFLLLFSVCSFFPQQMLAGMCTVLPGETYVFTKEPIDVVIPCAEKDLEMLELCIEGIRNNCDELRRIFVISSRKLTNNAEWIDERIFPFNKEDVARELFDSIEDSWEYMATPQNRLGWMYQQLLKFYAFFVIPGISSNILILDADTIFLNPVYFIQENGAAFFNYATQHSTSYFEHMERLLPGLRRADSNFSGVCHHMLFQRPVLVDLKSRIEAYHKKPMWKAILRCVSSTELYGSAFSEYEIYFNFALLRSNQFRIRRLEWENVRWHNCTPEAWKEFYHYVSAHDYLR